jgi:hypothetical protein
VLTSPARTFEALRQRPTWLLAFLLVVLVTGVVGQIGQAKVDPEAMIRHMMAGGGSAVPEERIEEIIERQENQSPVVAAFAALALVAIAPLSCALYFWLGTRLFGGEPTFRLSFSTVVHAFIPWWAVKALLALPVLLTREELTVAEATSGVLPSNLAGFLVDDTSPLVRILATSLDVFTLWGLFLLALGFSVVARISMGASVALTFLVWLTILGMTLLPLLLPNLLLS